MTADMYCLRQGILHAAPNKAVLAVFLGQPQMHWLANAPTHHSLVETEVETFLGYICLLTFTP